MRGLGALLVVASLGVLPLTAPQDDVRPVADHHQHLYSPVIAPASQIAPITARDLVALLDAAGIRRAVVLSQAYAFGNPNRATPVQNEPARVIEENDWTSGQVAQFPDRLVGFRAANDRRMAIVVHIRPTVSRPRPYGAAQARAFIANVLPSAPDIVVQIAHLAGAGGYDDPAVDEALGVYADAIAAKDPRTARVYFEVSGVAGVGDWRVKADKIVARIRQIGVSRILYGSDSAVGPGRKPAEAWASFRELPLTDASSGRSPPTSRRTFGSVVRQKRSAFFTAPTPLLTARSSGEDEPDRRFALISVVCRGCTWMRRASAE